MVKAVLVKRTGGGVECNGDIRARAISGGFDCFNDQIAGFIVAL